MDKIAGKLWDVAVYTTAIDHQNFKILKWAKENGCPWDYNAIARHRTRCGNPKIVKWIDENKDFV